MKLSRSLTVLALAPILACSPAPKEINAAELHETILTLDTHIDIPLNYMSEIDPSGPTELQVDLPKLKAGALDSGFWIVYTPQGDLTEQGYAQGHKVAETRNAAIQKLVATHHQNFALATTPQDVRAVIDSGKYAVLIGMENAYPLGESVDAVPMWAARGVRYMGITHFGHNQFGDSSNLNFTRDKGPRWNGLSPLWPIMRVIWMMSSYAK